ncbi:MAG TPA: hypothetical protein VLA36_12865 [Longimicrobiales bacterium]|nr:hypothetical protein [Longimicrobiales bacterium]
MLAKRVTCVALAAALAACSDGLPTEPDFTPGEQWTLAGARSRAGSTHFIGSVDVVWNGGQGSGPTAGADRTARGSMAVFPDDPTRRGGPGNFTFQVVEADGTVHREIGVELTWAGLEDQSLYPGEIRWVGVVVSDTKACGGSQHGGGGDEGGCGDDEGGCSHDDGGTHDEGGCSGGGGETGGHEPGGGSGGVSGQDCRIGQVVIGWALDGATPAVKGDRVSWKWFAPDAPKVLQIQQAIASGGEIPWPCKLCEKEILGGNLVLHLKEN